MSFIIQLSTELKAFFVDFEVIQPDTVVEQWSRNSLIAKHFESEADALEFSKQLTNHKTSVIKER